VNICQPVIIGNTIAIGKDKNFSQRILNADIAAVCRPVVFGQGDEFALMVPGDPGCSVAREIIYYND